MTSTYSTWEFYHDSFGGQLGQADYASNALRAKFAIDRRTAGQAAGAPEYMADQLAICECELLDVMYTFSQIPKGVSSLNNDGYSVTFGGRNSNDGMEDEGATQERIFRKYLTLPYNLLFGGACIYV